ncbi:MAG: 3'-5' exonuclease [Patescibacteria group bacterium]
MNSKGVYQNIFPSFLEEIAWISKKIRSLINNGVLPQNIAIIARKHKTLQQIVPILHRADIPINYERDENILDKPFIRQILQILKFIDSLNKVGSDESQELLPEILSYPFWRISNLDIYNISLKASQSRQNWLQIMENHSNQNIVNLADFLRELAKQAVSSNAEQILDEILGVSREQFLPQQESEENTDPEVNKSNYDPEKGLLNIAELDSKDEKRFLTKYISPYKWYYFDSNFALSQSDYFTFLSGLRVFFTAIRDYKKKQVLLVQDILEFVHLMEANKFNLSDKSSFNQNQDTVSLLTTHKAKGLEFEYVFVVNCTEKEWNGRKQTNKVGLPSNLALLPESENSNDTLRLLFVSITRAKQYLCLCSHTQSQDGKSVENLNFLEGIELQTDTDCYKQLGNDYTSLQIWLKSTVQNRDLSLDEKAFLAPILDNYKLSVTHLNNFLDLSKGGPKLFLEQNLLKFPKSKIVSGSYGSAMHSALAKYYIEFKQTKSKPNLDFLLLSYKESLNNERLSTADYLDCLDKGSYYLQKYYNLKNQSFVLSDRIEQDFSNQGVTLGRAKITGKIDKMCIQPGNHLLVIDLKTGKAFKSWKASAIHDQIKIDRYRRQLLFYKLLVENSRDFSSRYKVTSGSLEFLEIPNNDQQIVNLDSDLSFDEAEKLNKLIQVVYRKIQNFEFDIAEQYSKDLQGTQQFIKDLIQEY